MILECVGKKYIQMISQENVLFQKYEEASGFGWRIHGSNEKLQAQSQKR